MTIEEKAKEMFFKKPVKQIAPVLRYAERDTLCFYTDAFVDGFKTAKKESIEIIKTLLDFTPEWATATREEALKIIGEIEGEGV